MRRDRGLERELRELRAPDEAEAEARAWPVVRKAYAERVPVRPAPRLRRLVLVAAGGAAVLAIGLSPAGAKVGEFVEDVVGIGEEDAKPALRSLPAAGELLVQSAQGPWIVRSDGSKRLLGDYDEATWSPTGLYVAAARGRELAALETNGDVRWTYPAPGIVSDPRWAGDRIDTRIAYRSGDDLRVIAGDGTDDHLIARDVAPVAPVWLRSWRNDVAYPLAYLDDHGNIRIVDADRARLLRRVPTGDLTRELKARWVIAPDGNPDARIERRSGHSRLVVGNRVDNVVAFSTTGRLTKPTWSPDGRWILVGWPAADQWLFIDAARPRHIVPFGRISEQFAPGKSGPASFPHVSGWILPRR